MDTVGDAEKGILSQGTCSRPLESKSCSGYYTMADWRFGSKTCVGTQEERKLQGEAGAGS